nr:RNA-directed DNA polymerase, eukaryota [Tanacetum cinerariifolium]
MDSGSKGKLEEESDDDDVVSDTYNGDFSDKDGKPYESVNNQLEKETSNDPFKIYDLNKKSKEAEGSEHDASIPFPLGFTPKRIMIISVYAPHDAYYKRVLWSYLEDLVKRWNGECIIMGDFNEFRRIEERWGTNFNSKGAHVFNNFISNAGLVDIQLEGYSFTWAHPSGKKMSKLDRFLVSDGLLTLFPHMSVADEARESFQKAKIQWAVEGDETPNFFMELLIESAPIYVQSAFLPNRQILDGPFIINELLARCHHKKQSSMVFKVDFAKVYDSIRWDYLEDVLLSFGFGVK